MIHKRAQRLHVTLLVPKAYLPSLLKQIQRLSLNHCFKKPARKFSSSREVHEVNAESHEDRVWSSNDECQAKAAQSADVDKHIYSNDEAQAEAKQNAYEKMPTHSDDENQTEAEQNADKEKPTQSDDETEQNVVEDKLMPLNVVVKNTFLDFQDEHHSPANRNASAPKNWKPTSFYVSYFEQGRNFPEDQPSTPESNDHDHEELDSQCSPGHTPRTSPTFAGSTESHQATDLHYGQDGWPGAWSNTGAVGARQEMHPFAWPPVFPDMLPGMWSPTWSVQVPIPSANTPNRSGNANSNFVPHNSNSLLEGRPQNSRAKKDAMQYKRKVPQRHLTGTTVCLRNVPNNMKRKQLMQAIDEFDGHVFRDKYDFFYLAFDWTEGNNMGYAFINFTSMSDAKKFYAKFEGYKLKETSEKTCLCDNADAQGLDACMRKFRGDPVTDNHPVNSQPRRKRPIVWAKGPAGTAWAGPEQWRLLNGDPQIEDS